MSPWRAPSGLGCLAPAISPGRCPGLKLSSPLGAHAGKPLYRSPSKLTTNVTLTRKGDAAHLAADNKLRPLCRSLCRFRWELILAATGCLSASAQRPCVFRRRTGRQAARGTLRTLQPIIRPFWRNYEETSERPGLAQLQYDLQCFRPSVVRFESRSAERFSSSGSQKGLSKG